MADRRTLANLPAPTAEQRKVAADNFDRARQVITGGNFDYGIQLLLTCCKIEPASLAYAEGRKIVRRMVSGAASRR